MEAPRTEYERSEAASGDTTARNLRTVLLLAALFVLPLAGSFWLYYGADWRPAGHVNHGELIQPVRALPAVSLPAVSSTDPGGRPLAPSVFGKRKWALVYIGGGGCDRSCQYALYVMRQTWAALNTDTARVERVFLATGDCCDQASLASGQPGLIVLDASVSSGARLLAEFPRSDRSAMIFIVDPLGNLMMRYDSRRDPKGLLQDLRRLLRLSHIG
jgi:hypothetical protein